MDQINEFFQYNSAGIKFLAGVVLAYLIIRLTLSHLKSKIKKKIEDDSFSYGWLIRWNLLAVLLLYIASVVLSVVFTFILTQFFDFQSEFGLSIFFVGLFGIWIAPLAVFFLCFIPSLFISEFYLRKNIINHTSKSVILIAFIMIILVILIFEYFYLRTNRVLFNPIHFFWVFFH